MFEQSYIPLNRLGRRIHAANLRKAKMLDRKYRFENAMRKQAKLIREAREKRLDAIRARTARRKKTVTPSLAPYGLDKW